MENLPVPVYGIIYKCTNLINGKIYIGQTIKNLEDRKKEHEDIANTNRGFYFQKAIKKYGKENFKWEIIDSAFTKDELNFKEGLHIRSIILNSYNLTLGGDSFGNCWLLKNEEERLAWRSKISLTKKINKSNAGPRNSRYGKGYIVKGENNPMFGRTHSPESREKTRIGNKEYWQSEVGLNRKKEVSSRLSKCNTGGNNPKAKKVLCIETGEIFSTIKDVLAKLNTSDYLFKKSVFTKKTNSWFNFFFSIKCGTK